MKKGQQIKDIKSDDSLAFVICGGSLALSNRIWTGADKGFYSPSLH